jgi:hypothetical protein
MRGYANMHILYNLAVPHRLWKKGNNVDWTKIVINPQADKASPISFEDEGPIFSD